MKNRISAAWIALFLGWAGVHKFYLKDTGAGIFYLILLMITGSLRFPITFFLGVIDAIALFSMSDEKFDNKYNKNYDRRSKRGSNRNARYDQRAQRRYPPRDQYQQRDRSDGYSPRRDSYRKPPPRETKRPVRRPRENPFKKTGISKYKEFDLEGAIEDFNKGLELDPSDIALHFNLACAYSLTEKSDKSFHHLSKAVENGFKDIEKIKTHDDLAFLRIQDGFEEFQKDGYKISKLKNIPISDGNEAPSEKREIPEQILDDDILLSQLNKLSELRNKGLLSEKEFSVEKEKLMRR